MQIIITLIIISLFLYLLSSTRTEHFYTDPYFMGKSAVSGLYGKDSANCYNESISDCLNYANCGLCKKDGVNKCIPGDKDGSFFEGGCDHWTYKDYIDRHIYGKTITRTTRPYDYHAINDYETWWPSPIAAGVL